MGAGGVGNCRGAEGDCGGGSWEEGGCLSNGTDERQVGACTGEGGGVGWGDGTTTTTRGSPESSAVRRGGDAGEGSGAANIAIDTASVVGVGRCDRVGRGCSPIACALMSSITRPICLRDFVAGLPAVSAPSASSPPYTCPRCLPGGCEPEKEMGAWAFAGESGVGGRYGCKSLSSRCHRRHEMFSRRWPSCRPPLHLANTV